MKLAFQIAVRFLKSGKLQTLMIILGIAVGVSVQVFIGSLITGLQKSLVDKTIGSSSQITIKVNTTGEYITDYDELMDEINQFDSVKIISPALNTGVALRSLDSENPITDQSLLRGFTFEQANEIYKFQDKIVSGRLPNTINEVAIGVLLFESMDIALDDSIDVLVPGSLQTQRMKVVGVFDFNVRAVNESWTLATLESVQALLELDDVVNTVEMQLEDVFLAEEMSVSIRSMIVDDSLVVENWIEQNAELLSGLQGQSVSSLMIQVFVMISVVLAIASVLAITVLQKSKQIGILKAMGIQDKDASLVFLLEGFILGVFGAIAGVLLGLGLSYSFTTFAIGADGNPVVPLFIDFGFIALSAVIATMAATLAALIPARKSSKLSVIEVIRNA